MNANPCFRSGVLAGSRGESYAAVITNFGVPEPDSGGASVYL
jgi:hypothetical protein